MDGEIDTETLHALDPAEDDVRLIDIRPRSEYEAGHLPESECIPFPDLPEEITRLDDAKHIITVCPHGQASVKAARLIAAYDGLAPNAQVQSLAGGLEAWDGDLVSIQDSETPSHQQQDPPF